jgi:ribonuclease P protein component
MGAAPHPPTDAFPKSARLLRRREFLAVRQGGRGFAEGPLAASWLPREADRPPTRPASGGQPAASARVGLTVSSQVGGSAVRNRIRRRLREAVRRELSSLPAVDLVIVARASSKEAGVEEFRKWLRQVVKRIEREGARR